MNWITADPHFQHKNIIKYCNRPFLNTEEMDECLIQNINKVVHRTDTLYILGDFSWNQKKISPDFYLDRINCKNVHLILGNHDDEKVCKASKFTSVKHLDEIKIDGKDVTLCHYRMFNWNKSHRGAYQLFGHTHGALADNPYQLNMDVGVDTHWLGHNQYYPYSFDEINNIMNQKIEKIKEGKFVEDNPKQFLGE